ncbi:MAG TPA: TonB-dependent receptor [Bacteroidota bacterium]|nr:TonB-dependent receptor [Bacteroidota bacterium]
MKWIHFIHCIFLLAFACSFAAAQETSRDSAMVIDTADHPAVQLREVTVVAPVSRQESPSTTIEISPAVIQRTVPTDSWDLLRQTAGLEVHEQGQGPGFASDLSIRGFSSDHSTDVALMIDGIPINEPVNGHAEGYNDFSLLFPEMIKNIEIIKGPVSPLYGNFATSGAVSVTTLDRYSGLRASLSGGSYDHLGGTVLTGFDDGSTSGIFGIRGVHDGGWRQNSAWDLGQATGKINDELSERVAIQGAVSLYGTNWDSPGFLSVAQFDSRQLDGAENSSDGGFKRHALESVDARVIFSARTVWQTTLYATQGRWQSYLTIPPEPGSGEGSGSQTEEEDSRTGYGFTSAVTMSDGRNSITYGVQSRYDQSDYQNWFTTNRVRDSSQELVSAKQVSGGAFVQGIVRPVDRLRVSIGGRIDAMNSQSNPAGGASSSYGKSVASPKLGASYELASGENVYANVSKGFRQTDGVIGDPTLPYIIAWNYEAGVKLSADRASLDLAVFRMDVNNEQSFDPITLSSTSNGASRRDGFDATFNATASDDISLTASWTYTDPRYRDLIGGDGSSLAGVQIFNTARNVGTVAVDIAPHGTWWHARFNGNYVGQYAPFDEPGVILPSYAVFSATAGTRFDKATIDLGVKNIFNKVYPELRAGGFIDPGMPTTAYVTLGWEM